MDNYLIRQQILDELEANVLAADESQLDILVDAIDDAKQIFFSASAREMLVLSAFAMRVFHMGYHAYLLNETKTPPIGSGDLLICVCGCGDGAIRGQIETAHRHGAKVLCLTNRPDGPVPAMCEYVVQTHGNTVADNGERLQSLGSAYEQALLVTLDYVVHKMMKKHNWEEPDLEVRHTNME